MERLQPPKLQIENIDRILATFKDELARHYFIAIQDRHVPITPLLAESLADMTRKGFPGQHQIWGRAFENAGAAIGISRRLGNASIWRDTIIGFIQHIAEPIIRTAASRIGSVVLVAKHPINIEVLKLQNHNHYKNYSAELEKCVDELLDDPEIMGHTFWVMAGIAMLAMLHYRPNTKSDKELPFTDSLVASLFYELEPDLSSGGQFLKRYIQQTIRSKFKRLGIRPREGGVQGVIHSRRMEELGEALPSWMIVPKELRVLKLVEEGFFLTNRPPVRRPLRDILALTFVEGNPTSEILQIVRTAWLDATIRLQFILSDKKLTKSELILCDCTDVGISTNALSAENTTDFTEINPITISGSYRAHLLSTSTLCPKVFCSIPQKYYQYPDAVVKNLNQEGSVGPKILSCASKLGMKEATLANIANSKAYSNKDIKPAQPEDYSAVLACSVRPINVRGNEVRVPNWGKEIQELSSAIGSNIRSSTSFAFIGFPNQLNKHSTFYLKSVVNSSHVELKIPDAEDQKTRVELLLGQLSLWFIEQTLEALYA